MSSKDKKSKGKKTAGANKQQQKPQKAEIRGPSAVKVVEEEEEESPTSFLAIAQKNKSAKASTVPVNSVTAGAGYPKPSPVAVAVVASSVEKNTAPQKTKSTISSTSEEKKTPESKHADSTSPVLDDKSPTFEKKKRNISKTGMKTLQEKVHIPEGSAAYIIGRGGSNVKRINEQSGAKCMVKDTVVTISGNDKKDIAKAKKFVMELLRGYMTRTQLQTNEYNLLLHEEEQVDNMTGSFDEYTGPLSEWLVREQIPPKILDPSKKQEEKTEYKRPYFALNVDKEKQDDDDESLEDEVDQLYRLAQLRQSKNEVQSTTKGHSTPNASSNEENKHGASLLLVNEEVMDKTLSTLSERLAEEKQALQEYQMDESKNTFDTEIILGKKLFLPNPTDKKVKKSKQSLEKVESQKLGALLETKFGYNQKMNIFFNYAIHDKAISALEDHLKSSKSFEFECERQTINAHVRLNNKRAGLYMLIDADSEDKSEKGTILKKLKLLDYFERSSKLVLIDFVRSKSNLLDYRLNAKHYANVVPSEQLQKIISDNLRWDPEEQVIVIQNLQISTKINEVSQEDETTFEEKSPEVQQKEEPIYMFYIDVDRIKKERIYSDGVHRVVFSIVRDTLKEPLSKQDKKQKKPEKKEEDGSEASPTNAAPQEVEQSEEKEKVVIETTEVVITSTKLSADSIKDKKSVLKKVHGTLHWVQSLLEENTL